MDLTGKRVTVMGLGRFGGGLGVTRWLAAPPRSADVLVTDMEPRDKLEDSVAALRREIDSGAVRLRLGEHNVADFTSCELVVANVAVPTPWANRYLRAAEAARVPITTEIALFLERLPPSARERTIAVTGSVGKSTTAAMIHAGLSAAAAARGDHVLLGGNIGVSLLDQLPRIDDRTWLVLELSSAMLYWIDRVRRESAAGAWSPRVAVVTNIAPNHLDWHGDFEHYSACKRLLVTSQRPGDGCVLGRSERAGVWEWRKETPAHVVPIDAAPFSLPMKLPGGHNRENAAAARAACALAMPDAPPELFESAIAGFPGLPHRLQLVAEKRLSPNSAGAALFYNDSKSTTPESCLKAIEALLEPPHPGAEPRSSRRIHLIAGGYDKKADLTPIAQAAVTLAGLYTIGVTGPKLATDARGLGATAHDLGTLARAFATAVGVMKGGDVLLLSPGCASWDQYVNYEERGDRFITLVEALS